MSGSGLSDFLKRLEHAGLFIKCSSPISTGIYRYKFTVSEEKTAVYPKMVPCSIQITRMNRKIPSALTHFIILEQSPTEAVIRCKQAHNTRRIFPSISVSCEFVPKSQVWIIQGDYSNMRAIFTLNESDEFFNWRSFAVGSIVRIILSLETMSIECRTSELLGNKVIFKSELLDATEEEEYVTPSLKNSNELDESDDPLFDKA